jgi:streptogramin lyase
MTRRSGVAGAIIITVAALAGAAAGCGTQSASGARGPTRAVLTTIFRLPVLGIATGEGAAWATTGNAVLRIEPGTDRASQVLSDPRASLTGIAFGAGSLWVEDAAGLLRVNPATGRITARIGAHVSVLSFGEGALWALSGLGGGLLIRIDPATNAVRTFPLPAGKIEDLAAGEGAVWVSVAMPPSVGLLRVDPATGRVVARISGNHLFGQVAVGNGMVWASDGAPRGAPRLALDLGVPEPGALLLVPRT